ncbi:MAG: hypothetical protein J6P94_02220, partial [Oscillospiraceae bacterium]|nr:hypothetical protein [Oscillospiraceae bacterium]
ILFVPAKRIWKVGALRKCAGGTFLAKTAAAMPRGGKLLRPTYAPSLETPQVRRKEMHCATE